MLPQRGHPAHGGVLRQGDELMQISLTESELVVEVRIEPMNVGQPELG